MNEIEYNLRAQVAQAQCQGAHGQSAGLFQGAQAQLAGLAQLGGQQYYRQSVILTLAEEMRMKVDEYLKDWDK